MGIDMVLSKDIWLSASLAGIFLWFAPPSAQALAGTYTVSNSPGISDHGDPNRHGSLQWVLNQIGSTPAVVVLPGDSNYRIGTSRNVAVQANVNLVFKGDAVITFQSTNSTLTVFGSIKAGLQQIFDASPGQVRLQGIDKTTSRDPVQQYRRALIKEVYPNGGVPSTAPIALRH